MDYVVKGKKADGRYWIVGNVKQGKFGPQIELKNSPELRAMLDAAGDGRKLWLNMYEPKEPSRDVNDTAAPIADFGDEPGAPF